MIAGNQNGDAASCRNGIVENETLSLMTDPLRARASDRNVSGMSTSTSTSRSQGASDSW